MPSPLLDILGPLRSIAGGFSSAIIPAGSDAVPAGQAAWYGLVDALPFEDLGQEVFVYHVAMTLVSTDHASGSAPWGTNLGTKASIVVGTDIPSRGGLWTAGYCAVPSLVDGAVHNDQRYIAHSKFPVGNGAGTYPMEVRPSWNFAPFGLRLTRRHRIKAALVVHRDEFNALAVAGATLAGYADVRIMLGETEPGKTFAAQEE